MDTRPILLVEDNLDDVELTLRALQKNQIPNELVVAQSGMEALKFLFEGRRLEGGRVRLDPSIVLLDLKLPDIDGFEVLSRMRSDDKTKLIPVVVLTSSKEESDLLRAYSLGANSYVRKPVDFRKFLLTVQLLGNYWLDLNEPISTKEEGEWTDS